MENKETKKLYRSKKDKVVAGVCGGLGEYFLVDPIIFRILFVALAFIDGISIFIYILLAIIVPMKGSEEKETKDFEEKVKVKAESLKVEAEEFAETVRTKDFSTKRNTVALIVIASGFVLLAREFVPMPWLNGDTVAAIVLILLGVYILKRR